ncbi:unnamed protein product [Brugia pahangi]|uniref:Ovule protein n=1 Tax=Brugia pahangi TaxID=6280 RepID=A0A0N4TXD4_BRUPA|nr:unnamed protein product [Brugia pahangi]
MRKIEGNSALQYFSSSNSSERQSLVGKDYTTKSLHTGSTECEEDRAKEQSISCATGIGISEYPTQIIFKR